MSKLSLAVQKQSAQADPAETAIALLSQAERALADAITIASAVPLVASAKAYREWTSAVHAGEDRERQAAVFVLRAKRNAGARIAEAQARGEVATRETAHLRSEGHVAIADMPPATLAEVGVTRDESSEWKRLAAEYPTDADLSHAAELMDRPSVSGALRLAPLMSSDSPEWYTPRHIVDAVVAVLGAIDLDPCADPGKGIPAATHYTAEDDGLAYGWQGRVYMNPPYGREIDEWIDKLAEEYRNGNVVEAIALVPGRIDTRWWHRLPFRDWLAVKGRLAFSESESKAPFPSAACYLGPNPVRFREVFAPLGDGYTRWETAA